MKKITLKTLITLISLITLITISNSPIYAATYSLSPQTINVPPSSNLSVDIIIDTEGEQVLTADAVFDYEQALLTVNSVIPGDFFPNTVKSIDPTQILIGGNVTSAANTKSGLGTLATINFSTVASGSATLAFNCTNGNTSDSNIFGANGTEDLLDCTDLTDGLYTISGSAPTQPPQGSLPNAGTVEKTLIFAAAGIILTIVGIIVML